MASKSRKKSSQSRRQANNTLTWLITAAAGIVVIVVAALIVFARDEDGNGPGESEFDPNFEPQVTGAPRVEVVQDDVLDYGNVKLGTTVTTEYNVRNVGDRQLVVLGEPRVELVEGC